MVSAKRAARVLFTRERLPRRFQGNSVPTLRMTTSADHPILMSMAPVSRTLADFLARTSWADLPRSVIVDTQRAILDWLGSALAGSIERPARIAQQVVAGFGAGDEATVFSGRRSS